MAFGLQAKRDDYIDTVQTIAMEAQNIDMPLHVKKNVINAAYSLATAMREIPDIEDE